MNLRVPLLLLSGFACAWAHDARADLTSYVHEPFARNPEDVNAEEREQLKALGYLQ